MGGCQRGVTLDVMVLGRTSLRAIERRPAAPTDHLHL
ncbi:hypothetical protein EMIT0324P_11611 [Pseudomonas chlororaphis]